MARRGASTRLERGIFSDEGGYRVVATFGKKYKEQRMPLSSTITELRDTRDALRRKLKKGRTVFEGNGGTFAGDVREYLKQIRHIESFKSRKSELWAWSEALGQHYIRSRLDETKARQICSKWLADGMAQKTVINRCIALSAMFYALDGEEADVPTKRFKKELAKRLVKRRPLTVTPDVILMVDENLAKQERPLTKGKPHGRMKDAKTRARFRVLSSMGIRPATLKRITPAQLDLQRRTLLMDGTKSGEPLHAKLNADMFGAWCLFVSANAWGKFDTRSFARVLRTAGWPKDVRPYNVRHSLGQHLSEEGEDFQDIADWLGDDVETVRKHYVPVLNSRLAKMSDRAEGRLKWRVPSPVPSPAETTRKNAKQIATQPVKVRTRKTG
jgi:site-specific recombinase XerC